jgi:heat shock protein HspQ
MAFSRVTFNLVGAKHRYETFEGKQYLVVPTSMINEGVYAGSQGPLYYPPDELFKRPVTWNMKPVVIYHPLAGNSACDTDVIRSQGAGFMMDTKHDNAWLKTEAYLDEVKANSIDRRVVDNIKAGKTVEVSTGLFHDPDMTPGTWNGKAYNGIVRNIQPDHLAILPDQVGACSIADGAGMLRNAEGSELSFDDIREQARAVIKSKTPASKPVNIGGEVCSSDYVYISDVYPKYFIYECNSKSYKANYNVRKNKVALVGEPEEVRKVTSYVTANGQPLKNEEHQGPLKKPTIAELSPEMRKQQFQKALNVKYAGIQQEGDWGGWITDIYANFAVYSKDGKEFRLPYTYDDDKIRFDGEPEEVERVSEYRAKNNTPIDGTISPNTNKGSNMTTPAAPQVPTTQQPAANAIHQGAHEMFRVAAGGEGANKEGPANDSQVRTTVGAARKEEVGKMISGGGWKEEDRSMLEGLPDDHFQRVSKYTIQGATQPIVPYSYQGIGDRSNVHGSGGGAHNQRQQAEEWLTKTNAPPHVRETVLNSIQEADNHRRALINIITKNADGSLRQANVFSPEWLYNNLDINLLKGIAHLAKATNAHPVQNQYPQGPNYSGQGGGGPSMYLNGPTTNVGPVVDDEVLTIPLMNFAKEQTQAS